MRKGYLQALRAVVKAISETNCKVAVLSLTDQAAKENFRMYFEIVVPLFSDADAKAHHASREIHFSNGSRIVFRTGEEQLRGLRLDDIVRD